jgi:endogenous inhibitor of DNA gyrase (YacG/DUF329 family)
VPIRVPRTDPRQSAATFTPIVCAPYNVRVIAPALCVVCRQRPIEEAWRPFCSERCKLQDLARWLDGVYRVPGDPASTDDRVPESNHDGPTHDE